MLPSLKVGVSCSEVTYYADKTRLPSYGPWSTYYEATQGKDGGMDPGDTALLDSVDIFGSDLLHPTVPASKRGVNFKA